MVNPLCTGRNQMRRQVSNEPEEAVTEVSRDASEFEQAMAELGKANDNELKGMLLQKYGVVPVQLTEQEQEECR